VLRPGGVLVLIAEVHRQGPSGWVLPIVMAPTRAAILTAEQHRQVLAEAGYHEVQVITDPRGWICAVGRSPAAAD
jgi:hypothetical protein